MKICRDAPVARLYKITPCRDAINRVSTLFPNVSTPFSNVSTPFPNVSTLFPNVSTPFSNVSTLFPTSLQKQIVFYEN